MLRTMLGEAAQDGLIRRHWPASGGLIESAARASGKVNADNTPASAADRKEVIHRGSRQVPAVSRSCDAGIACLRRSHTWVDRQGGSPCY